MDETINYYSTVMKQMELKLFFIWRTHFAQVGERIYFLHKINLLCTVNYL